MVGDENDKTIAMKMVMIITIMTKTMIMIIGDDVDRYDNDCEADDDDCYDDDDDDIDDADHNDDDVLISVDDAKLFKKNNTFASFALTSVHFLPSDNKGILYSSGRYVDI